jgi:hypothetical protein
LRVVEDPVDLLPLLHLELLVDLVLVDLEEDFLEELEIHHQHHHHKEMMVEMVEVLHRAHQLLGAVAAVVVPLLLEVRVVLQTAALAEMEPHLLSLEYP